MRLHTGLSYYQVRIQTFLALRVNLSFPNIAAFQMLELRRVQASELKEPQSFLCFASPQMGFCSKMLKHKGSHQIFFLKKVSIMLTLLSRSPHGFHSDSHSCQYCDIICHNLMKKIKRNTVLSLPSSISPLIHVANPKDQEVVNKPCLF